MDRTFILIPGRSSRQGVTLNEGKYTQGYIDETSTLRMHPDDMGDVGVQPGEQVRMWNEVGSVVVPVISAVDECPVGLVFICYGDKSSQLMAGETHGTGMPDSKGLDVHIEAVNVKPPIEASVVQDEQPSDQKLSAAETIPASSVVETKPVVAEPEPSTIPAQKPGHAAKRTTVKKDKLDGREPTSAAQIVVVVLGLIALLILLLTSGR